MRRSFVWIIAIAALIPSSAHAAKPSPHLASKNRAWTNVHPCAPVCPQDTYSEAAAAGKGPSDRGKALCAISPLATPQSWQDIMEKVPSKIGGYKPKFLDLQVAPVVDWDVVVCQVTADQEFYKYIAGPGTNSSCVASQGPAGLGCTETLRVPVKPGQRLVLRAYNRSDPLFDLDGSSYYEGVK